MASRRQVLHVDDDILTAKLVRRILEGAGYAVSSAHNFGEALRALDAHRPDLILLDVDIGAENGYALCELMREAGTTAAVAFLTANRTLDHVRQAQAAGGDHLIIKPFSTETLLAGIAKATAARRRITGGG
jgi:DNA-binding response OmpR family regulator